MSTLQRRHLMYNALEDVRAERDRQARKIAAGLIPWDCANPVIDNASKLPVLIEEVGEVARAMLEARTASDPQIREELIHVAAVAVAWAESLA